MQITFWIIAGLVDLAWSALAARLIALATGKWFRFLAPIDGPILMSPSVDAIVPARNEAENIASTVEALQAQEYPNLTITVIDDQSTDSTASILDRLASTLTGQTPIRVIRGSERPEGWVGKTWAVHQGVNAVHGEWLWFVDADMGLHPRALATALAEADRTGADLVSLMPGVQCRTFWQGSIALSFLQVLGQLYPLDRVNDPDRPDAIAAGGFILVRRTTYDRAGGHGHETVRRAIIEDIALARRVKATGGRLDVRLAPRLTWTHMYGSFGDIWRGLRKNAYAGMDYLPHKYVTGALVALLLAWSPAIALAIGLVVGDRVALTLGILGVLAQAVASSPILVFLRLPARFAFTVPLGISAYVAIASASVWHHHRGRILWKDRAIPSTIVESSSMTKMDAPD